MTATSIEKVNGHVPDRGFDAVALAKADAIRTEADAKADALRIEAEGKAEAEKILAAEKAEKERLENEKSALANERAALRFKREQAEQLAKIAEAERKREETERARKEARREAEEQQQSEVAKAKVVKESSERWRKVALGFYGLCAAVALPVQMFAFYDPDAKYLLVAPIFIEVIALVALVGAAAAVTDGRPQWHYRLVAWVGALTAASINIVHGLDAFDPATAFGTALASVAGPGMWDLHEHGRLRKRDGKPSWRERRAARKEAERAAAEKAAEELREAEHQAYREKAEREAERKLAEDRAREFPKVWEHALKIAAALGETTVTEAVWKRAHRDVEGADPAESAAIIRLRNAAEMRVEAARQKRPVSGSTQQVASQVPGAKKPRIYNPPARRGKRTKGDVQYTPGARRQASIAARSAAVQTATEKKG
ncbi:hypothetical protein JL475_00355 [Streptomyces sp. M2CJ-2]|uniref:hypothetical protein n=1 Tax=Streptomyces sp. M2CJ-2 TaxID=2803948 RepID=UPI001922B9C8|nr:hypothetical protein [Streptomyces sp. M2CJ-2]MBL3664497.1 hypothetical protein [Streptomyces sp. M2CJ-2]